MSTLKEPLKSPFSRHKFYLTSLDNQYRRVLNLTQTQHKVWAIILGHIDNNNSCSLSSGDISEQFDIDKGLTSRALKVLQGLRLIYRIKRTIFVDPHYCWKGAIDQHYRALHQHKHHVPDYYTVLDALGHTDQPF